MTDVEVALKRSPRSIFPFFFSSNFCDHHLRVSVCVWVKLYNVTSCVVDGFLRAIETVEASNDKRVFLQKFSSLETKHHRDKFQLMCLTMVTNEGDDDDDDESFFHSRGKCLRDKFRYAYVSRVVPKHTH